MIRPAVGLLFAASLCSQQLILAPAGGCANGLASLRITWSAPGAGAVRVLAGTAQDRQPLTGWEPGQGSAETGQWVTDGMPFVLEAEGGRILAAAVAALECGVVDTGFAWLPLQLGNRWVYRLNTRQVTASYVTRTVVRAVEEGGFIYYVLDNPETLLRTDAEGRIFQRASGRDTLLLDPSGAAADAALRIESRRPVAYTPFGEFPGALDYRTMVPLRLEFGTYVRGLGLVRNSASILAGSSGGFSDSLELQEARIAGRFYFRKPVPALTLGVEGRGFDVTGRRATNCAVPCYFTACGLVPGADPPGTYKPCFEARAAVERGPAALAAVQLTLLGPGGASVYSATLRPADAGDFLSYLSIPLYTAPSQPLPPGRYRLRARLLDGAENQEAEASADLEIY